MDLIKKINRSKNIWSILHQFTIDDLQKILKLAADSYYNSGKSLINDEIYDILVERLKQLNPASKILDEVGAPVRGKKVLLPFWMGSMNKIKANQVDKWKEKYEGPYLISDKLDGISCLLHIVRGTYRLYTRGLGDYGQDITHLLDLININMDDIDMSVREIAIRGELIMSKKKFEKYPQMANARNMVGGIVNSKKESVNVDHARDVDFVTYEIITPLYVASHQMEILDEMGFNVVFYEIYEDFDLTTLDKTLLARKKKSIYEIDGIIVTQNKKYIRNVSGNPSYSFAYKGMTQTANVEVTEVVWRPSKDGFLTPVIYFKPVKLSGALLKRTLGFNAGFIEDNGIGPGAIIKIIRSGVVIPYILDIIESVEPSFPTDYDYVWDENHVNILINEPETNESVIIQRLTKFVRQIGAENLSEGIIARLVNAGYDTIPKIISIQVEDMLDIPGFKTTLATKLYNNLQNALENVDIKTLMVASNVFGRGLGEKKIVKILEKYPDIVNNYHVDDKKLWENRLLEIDGFNTITIQKFLKSLPKFIKFYKKITKIIDVLPYKTTTRKGGKFKNQIIMFTGFRDKNLEKIIVEEGGKVSTSVSKNTTLLVYGNEDQSQKFVKAKNLGIEIISRENFLKKYKL